MKNKLSLLILSLFSLSACSSPDITPDLNNMEQVNINTAKVSTNNSPENSNYLKSVISSLDLNNDGKIEATEVPILVGGKNVNYVYNNDGSAITGYLPKQGTEMTVNQILDMMNKGAGLSIMSSKVSEKNKTKIISNFVSSVMKDPLAEKGKVSGFATTVGYFTAKTTVVIRSMDASILKRELQEQLDIGNGTINGQPYQSGNGSVTLLPNLSVIDGKYKARLNFSDYNDFESGIQLFGYTKIKDASGKIVSDQ